MNYLVFDTETTGLPLSWGAPASDLNNWPRITQLAFILYDGFGNEIISSCKLIKPDEWVIPKEKFFIDNNMTTKRCEKEGIPIFKALREFQEVLKIADYKIAHNIRFDNNIVESEMIRNSITPQLFKYKKSYCTMMKTTNLCNIKKTHGGGNKWPKLIELHQYLFGTIFSGAHDALEDVRATGRCFFELKRINHTNI